VERTTGNALLAEKKSSRFTAPVSISIYSTRCRATDIDNISGKAVLDGLVNCGIFKDDSPEFIESYQVHKAKIGKEEKTVISINII
jgi:Holliday junction resolvase RusA-like endonuclease